MLYKKICSFLSGFRISNRTHTHLKRNLNRFILEG